MATIAAEGGGSVVNLSTAQSSTGASTNVARRRPDRMNVPALLRVVTSAGTSISWTVEGSVDGTNFYPLPYVDVSTATAQPAPTSAAITTTGAAKYLVLPVDQPWTYLRVNIGAVTATSLTADITVY